MKSGSGFLKNVTFLILICLLCSCRRDKVISISGRLINGCTQVGVPNHKLRISFQKSKSYFTSSKVNSNANAGSGETDDKGNFKFTFVQQTKNGTFTLIDESNSNHYEIDIYKESNLSLEVGEIFSDSITYQANLNINFKNRIDATDTLFLRVSGKTDTLFPSSLKNLTLRLEQTTAVYHQIPIPFKDIEAPFQWGFGHVDFMKKDKVHLFNIKFNSCNFQPYENSIELYK